MTTFPPSTDISVPVPGCPTFRSVIPPPNIPIALLKFKKACVLSLTFLLPRSCLLALSVNFKNKSIAEFSPNKLTSFEPTS